MRARIMAHREASQNRADQAVTQFDPRPYQTASTTVPTSAILAENVREPMPYFPMAIILAALSGCQTSTGILPAGPNTYTLTRLIHDRADLGWRR
jgi:hypothetical protein